MNHLVVDLLAAHKSWGKNALVNVIPEPYKQLARELSSQFPVTSLGTQAVLELLVTMLARKEQCEGPVIDFYTRLSEETSMLNKDTVTALLKSYWQSHMTRLKEKPLVYEILKGIIIELQSDLKPSNSNPKLRADFTMKLASKLLQEVLDNKLQNDDPVLSLSKALTKQLKESNSTEEEFLREIPLTVGHHYDDSTDTFSCMLIHSNARYKLEIHDNQRVVNVVRI